MIFSLEKFEKRMAELEPRRYCGLEPITPMESMEATGCEDAPYTELPNEFTGTDMQLGDFFVGRDRYLWLRKKLVLPKANAGYKVTGLFDFGVTGGGGNSGFESLLYVNGKPYQGVDSNHQDVFLQEFAGREAELTFLLWTGLEGGGKKKTFYHQMLKAHVGYLHEAADKFYYYLKAVCQELQYLTETDGNKYILTDAMEEALKLVNWDEDKLHATIVDALELFEKRIDASGWKSPVTVNCIGHTHIDVAWLWRLKHTREKSMRSFATALRLMKEYDEFVFLQTQPQLYQYLKHDCPELYEEIKQRVKDGKWEAEGGMWLEADCNITSGESLVRQMLYGTEFFRKEFGVECRYLWLPDVFGYSWALPQILKQCNIKTFMTTKISWNQFNSIPNDLFTWRGIDGSEILTYFVDTPEENQDFSDRFSTYNGMLNPRSIIGSWTKFKNKDISNQTLVSYGYGDGGGGVNREMLELLRVMNRLPGLPAVKPVKAGQFFEEIHKDAEAAGDKLALWDGELYLEYHRGTYTSQANSKKRNRKLENKAQEAEWLSTLAGLWGRASGKDKLKEAWEIILRNQFHDIIPGSSIREVYQDSMKEYDLANSLLNQVKEDAWEVLGERMERSLEDSWYTVYHGGAYDQRGLVFIETEKDISFTDERENRLEAQKTEGGYLVDVLVPARSAIAVRGCGYGETEESESISSCCGRAAGDSETVPFCWDERTGKLETPYYTICWNEDGHLCRIYDKENDREVLADGECGNVLEIYEDRPLNHDAWDVDIYYTQKKEIMECIMPAEVVETGALRAVVRFAYHYNQSDVVQDMIVYRDSRRIDFKSEVEWQEDHRLLKTSFPVNVRSTKASYDIQFGHVERTTHFNTSWDMARFEVAAHKWADFSETGYGVALMNDCKYGYSIKDHVMKLSLLKSAKHPDTQADMGHHSFTYSLLPHKGSLQEGRVIEESTALNQPLEYRGGNSVICGRQIFTCNTNAVQMDVVKPAEDGRGLILRIHECHGSTVEAVITSDFHITGYEECNLLEQSFGIKGQGAEIRCRMKPFQIRTFRISLEK